MSRRPQDVRLFGLQDRRARAGVTRPWVVRWVVEGRQRAKAFRTRAEADRYRSELYRAIQAGEPFDDRTGLPARWSPSSDDTLVWTWARRWLQEQWSEWQPRTRTSAVEALARLVLLAVADGAASPPLGMRGYLVGSLPPGAVIDEASPEQRWLQRWGLTLSQLDRPGLATVDQRLGVGDEGQALSASTASRYRKIGRACIRRAVELDVLEVDPWPPAPQGRSRRKAARRRKGVDIRLLPDPATMVAAIDAIVSHQPASRMYRTMTAIAYYAGMRPSEVVMLRRCRLELPCTGWGLIDVKEADIDFDVPGDPKTGPRTVPIPPQLVGILREWVDGHDFAPDDLLFRTRSGKRPTSSNWLRAWQRAQRSVGLEPLRIYDCRHAAATTWLQAGVPLGAVAARLGHSVETLVSTYVGALDGDEAIANDRIDAVLARAVA